MALTSYLNPQRIIITRRIEKEELINKLIDTIARDTHLAKKEDIKERIQAREQSVSTRIGEGIALPHALIDTLPSSMLAIGICHDGVIWDWEEKRPIYLVILLAGNRNTHLSILSEIAWYLRDREVYEQLLDCRTGEEVYDFINNLEKEQTAVVSYGEADVSRVIFRNAWDIAREIGNGKVVLHADAISNTNYITQLVKHTSTIIVTNAPDTFPSDFRDEITLFKIPFKGVAIPAYVNFALFLMLSQGVIKKNDIIVNVHGAPDAGYVDSITLSYISEEFDFPFSIQSSGVSSKTGQQVLTRVLQIVGELAREGREGKPVGTLFVVGDYENVKKYSHQLIVNPFQGYIEEERNILDPSIEETVKEYAKLDGAFIISEGGTILSAGSYLSGQPKTGKLLSGLGARHAAAVGITTVTAAFSIVLSESTRKISVFHTGKRVFSL